MKDRSVEIGGRIIGDEYPAFVIAEAGVNHNGNGDLAKELVREAKRAGADCVKFQTFVAEQVVTAAAPKAEYQLRTTDPSESQLEMLKKLELPVETYEEVLEVAREENIVVISTPYNLEDVDLLEDLGVAAFKTASIHIAEPLFLEEVARRGKPVIASTGMATLGEVEAGIRSMRDVGNDRIVLLQCTTNYPSPVEDANLRTIPMMRSVFDVLVGYSDHTQSSTACIASVALGARVIEKHFTLDKSMPGPDQSSSADPDEFRELVERIREAELCLGSGFKEPTDAERKNAPGMRRSIVLARDVAAGATISKSDLTFKRPGTGLRPAMAADILGRHARHDLREGTMLHLGDLD